MYQEEKKVKPAEIKLSVALITYNQKRYIEQAIEGILQQKTSFAYELIIGDDFSSDGTRDILINYQKKYPQLINLILHPQKNKGIPGATNFLSVIQAATGKYVALLDGDDYWTDPLKLQKQVDFLEANSDYSICCHRIYIKKDKQKPKLYADEFAPSGETTYDIEGMAIHGNLVAAPSVVYRNNLFHISSPLFDRSPIGDYVLHMMNAQYGKIKYLPDAMAVYRDHSKGTWSGNSVKKNTSRMITVIELLLAEPFRDSVKKGLSIQLIKLKSIYLNELMEEDWNLFSKEFNGMMGQDTTIALALIEKMKMDRDSLRQSRTYKLINKIKSITKE